MDLRTLFLAQTCALVSMAAMFWVARAEDDRRNGLQTWTMAITSQGVAYLLLAAEGRWPVWLSGTIANAAGATSVALYFIAIRQFLGLSFSRWRLAAMVLIVTAVAALAGTAYARATVFNGFAYGLVQLLNAHVLWRGAAAQRRRLQRVVAAFYLIMGLVLPLRATVLWLGGTGLHYLDMPIAWQEPIYIFGFVYIVVTNLGFLQLCKMRAESEVREQAMTDGLTGLPNRRALNEAMAHSLATAPRSQRPFAVVMCDLDHFKSINDRLGHRGGDEALAAFAQRLHSGLRAQDRSFRYGGEEFSVLLPDTDAAGALVLAERLRRHVALPAGNSSGAVSASFGIAVWRPGDSANMLFGRADQALYRAKAAGRDRVEIE